MAHDIDVEVVRDKLDEVRKKHNADNVYIVINDTSYPYGKGVSVLARWIIGYVRHGSGSYLDAAIEDLEQDIKNRPIEGDVDYEV